MTLLALSDSPKMIRETLCVVQHAVVVLRTDRQDEHVERIQRLIDATDVLRPLGPDGKHGVRHTPTCGCDDVSFGQMPVQASADGLRAALSTWLTMALDTTSNGVGDWDLHLLRDWIDAGCDGDMPLPGVD